jgi:hypothetical protein
VNATRLASLPGVIAWLSVCLLAAAYGHLLSDRWHTIWADAGAFGLVAAFALSNLERVRDARTEQARDRELRSRLECGLARLAEHTATLDSINMAAHRIAAHARHGRRHGHKENRPLRESELLDGVTLEVRPIDEQDPNGDPRLAAPIAGTLRQISSAVIAFEHAEPLGSRLALLTFPLQGDASLTLVVEITWTKKNDQHLASSGTILAVGVPSPTVQPDAPSGQREALALAV